MILPHTLALLLLTALPAATAAPWVCYRASARAPVYTDAPVSGPDSLCFPREEGLSGAFSRVGESLSPPPEERKRTRVRLKRRGSVDRERVRKNRQSSASPRKESQRKRNQRKQRKSAGGIRRFDEEIATKRTPPEERS
jgi:hypothetical protein